MKNYTKMTKIELRATWGLGAVFSLRMFGMFMVLPVLSNYGMSLQDANKVLIGFAIGIYGLTQSIFQIPLGLLSDKFGRKPIIVSGLLIFAIGSAIAAITNSIWGIIIGRALQGSGAIAAAIMAMLSDLTREKNRTKAMAFIGFIFGITFFIAMVLGPIITNAIGINGLFCTITVLSILGIALTLLVVPNTIDENHNINHNINIFHKSFVKVISNFRLLKFNISIFCLHALLMSNFIALPPIMTYAGFLPVNQWKIYLFTILISFTIITPAIFYVEVKQRIKLLFLSSVTLLIVSEMIFLETGNNIFCIFTGIQIFFIAFNFMEAILPSLISKISPVSYKGTAMGIYSTFQFFGGALGSILSGFLLQFQEKEMIFLVNLFIALVWLFVILTMHDDFPYISSLQINLPKINVNNQLIIKLLHDTPGVTEVLLIPEDHSIYIKFDAKQTNKIILEKTITTNI